MENNPNVKLKTRMKELELAISSMTSVHYKIKSEYHRLMYSYNLELETIEKLLSVTAEEIPIDKCLNLFFTLNKPQNELCHEYKLKPKQLQQFAKAFNRYLIKTQCPTKTYENWSRHFLNWLELQNFNVDPKKLNIINPSKNKNK